MLIIYLPRHIILNKTCNIIAWLRNEFVKLEKRDAKYSFNKD